MANTGISNSLLERIRKLVRLQESATKVGSIEEAANAAQKIQDLLMKHNLDMQAIGSTEQHQEEEVGENRRSGEDLTGRNEGQWVIQLTRVIGKHNLCVILGSSVDKNSIHIIGTQTNAEVVWYTVEQLVPRIRQMARTAFSKYEGNEKRNTFIRGYLIGVCNGIDEQLTENEKNRLKEAEMAEQIHPDHRIAQATQAIALRNMVVVQKKRVQEYIQGNMRVKSSRGPSYSGLNGRAQGYQDGKSMSVSAQKPQTNKSRLLG